MKNSKGFTIVEIILVLVVVAVLGFVGYRAYDSQQTKTADTTSQSPTATDVSSAPAVNTTEDLDTASVILDQTDPSISDTDTAQLDSELATF